MQSDWLRLARRVLKQISLAPVRSLAIAATIAAASAAQEVPQTYSSSDYVQIDNENDVAQFLISTNLHSIKGIRIGMNNFSGESFADIVKLANLSCTNLQVITVHGPIDSPTRTNLLDFKNVDRMFFYYTSGNWSHDLLANLKATNMTFCVTTNLFQQDVRALFRNPNLRRIQIQSCKQITSFDVAELEESDLDAFVLINNHGRTEWKRHKPPPEE